MSLWTWTRDTYQCPSTHWIVNLFLFLLSEKRWPGDTLLQSSHWKTVTEKLLFLKCYKLELSRATQWAKYLVSQHPHTLFCSTHITSSAVTYHQFLDKSFSLRHHFFQLSDDPQILRTTLSVPELLLGSFEPERWEATIKKTLNILYEKSIEQHRQLLAWRSSRCSVWMWSRQAVCAFSSLLNMLLQISITPQTREKKWTC